MSRRRMLYLAGLLPSLLMLMVSGRIGLMLWEDAQGSSAYAEQDWESARSSYERNGVLNPFERWVAPLDEGVALFRLDRYDEAVDAFRDALDHAPADRECDVRVNLALAHERAGNQQRRDGDLVDARSEWASGRRAVEKCVPSWPSARKVDARLERKIGPELERGAPPPSPESPDPDERKKLRELEQLNREAAERQQEQRVSDELERGRGRPAW